MDKLNFIKQQMSILNIPYEFMEWTGNIIPDSYWVGEYAETPPSTEDGCKESTMLLTGFTRGKWIDLLREKEKIENHFDPVNGLRGTTESGTIVVFFADSTPVPTGEADLKRLQITLTIKEWKGRN